MVVMIAPERRLRMRMPGRGLVVQNVVNWRAVRGYGRLWRGSSDWIGRPIKIKCSKCSLTFRERAHKIRNDFQMQCPHCIRLITFDSSSEDINIRRALRQARALQPAPAASRFDAN